MKQFDVIVVGGGHAGCEAAAAAMRRGAKVALVTQRLDRIGALSCNPAVGGVGKGHLVREIDALDGLIGKFADFAGIQFRVLNRSKGPAVHGPRVQCDRDRYARVAQRTFRQQKKITAIESEVVDLIMQGNEVTGVQLIDGTSVFGRAAVLTAGTFLCGKICRGDEVIFAGRIGDKSSIRLADRFADLNFPIGRLKTGTPPRLHRSSINFENLAIQYGDQTVEPLSFLSKGPLCRQMPCYSTRTNVRTHDVVTANMHLSPIETGGISGRGPRYCPSLEEKIRRFPDRSSHQIFLEPEGLNSASVYPNGVSTSLPIGVQEELVRTIDGMESAKILQPGYSVEYSYFDPRHLRNSLESRDLKGLFLAGQINGTTGYEEAAAQGVVAGSNAAALALNLPTLCIDRRVGYIGVLIDDLVTKGVTEPYRMFTSRAEERLYLRPENADQRLTPIGIDLGLVTPARRKAFEEKISKLERARITWSETESVSNSSPIHDHRCRAKGGQVSLETTLSKRESVCETSTLAHSDATMLDILRKEAVYRPYLERARRENDRLSTLEDLRIPPDLDFQFIGGLSGEVIEKLAKVRPESIAQASRMEGITPAAVAILYATITRL